MSVIVQQRSGQIFLLSSVPSIRRRKWFTETGQTITVTGQTITVTGQTITVTVQIHGRLY